jgi:hypothetical protein
MPALVRDDFDRPDGALGTALTGQTWNASGGAAIRAKALALAPNAIARIDTGRFAYTVYWSPASSLPNAQQNCRLRFAAKDDKNWAQLYNLNGVWCYTEMVEGKPSGFVKLAPSARWSSGMPILLTVGGSAWSARLMGDEFHGTISAALGANTSIAFAGSTGVPETVDNVVVWTSVPDPLFVAPQGGPAGEGSIASPMDLQSALNFAPPGTTIRMRDGVYTPADGNGFVFRASGTPKARIRLIQDSPGLGRAIIDGYVPGKPIAQSQGTLNLFGSRGGNYVDLYGFRVTNSDASRSFDGTSKCADGGVQIVDAVATNLYHIISDNHGCTNFSLFGSNEGGVKYYGLLSFNNGNPLGFNGGSGYGIYEQSDPHGDERKVVQACILWNTYGQDVPPGNAYLIHSYAHHGNLENQDFLDNILLASPAHGGAIADYIAWGQPILWGSFRNPVVAGTFQRNVTMKPFSVRVLRGQSSIGYSAHDNHDVQVLDNHFMGGCAVNTFRTATLRGNVLVATGTVNGGKGGAHPDSVGCWDVVRNTAHPSDLTDWSWGANTYYDAVERPDGQPAKYDGLFAVEGESSMAFDQVVNDHGPWRNRAGDMRSTLQLGLPAANVIKVNTSPYGETGILATVGVVNYTKSATIQLGDCGIAPGTLYAVYHIADLLWSADGKFVGMPTASGTMTAGGTITVPGLPDKTLQTPVGVGKFAPANPQAAMPGEIAAYVIVRG